MSDRIPIDRIPIDRISLELTDLCSKGCWFCYNHSTPAGTRAWPIDDLLELIEDCADHGVRAVSFGGGEPLSYPPLFDVLTALRGRVFRSITTHGLLLEDEPLERLVAARPDKVHVSIHVPGNLKEVERVIQQVTLLKARGIPSGVNLLVARSGLEAAAGAARRLHEAGIGNERIVYLPMRGQDTPTPLEVAKVADGPFQSMSCLSECGSSPRFCSIAVDRTVAWCSYTTTRRKLEASTWRALTTALEGLGLAFCGGTSP